MTSPLPIIVDSEATERKMARPEHEVAVVIDAKIDQFTSGDWADYLRPSGKLASEEISEAVLDRLVQLGFLNDNYFVAKKAEEAGDAGRGT